MYGQRATEDEHMMPDQRCWCVHVAIASACSERASINVARPRATEVECAGANALLHHTFVPILVTIELASP